MGSLLPIMAWFAGKILNPDLIARLIIHLAEHWVEKSENKTDDKILKDFKKVLQIED